MKEKLQDILLSFDIELSISEVNKIHHAYKTAIADILADSYSTEFGSLSAKELFNISDIIKQLDEYNK